MALRRASTYALGRVMAAVSDRQQAMAARGFAGGDAEDFQRNHLLIEHGDQPAHGADEEFSALAPVHILWPVQAGNFFG